MSTVLLVDARATAVAVRRVRLGDRVLVRLRAGTLDAALAAGAHADSSVALALHTRRLLAPATRRALARRLREVCGEAERPPAPLSAKVPVCRRKVAAARGELHALATGLQDTGPLTPATLARLRLLLRDGLGPLYHDPDADDMRPLLRDALGDLRAPHYDRPAVSRRPRGGTSHVPGDLRDLPQAGLDP